MTFLRVTLLACALALVFGACEGEEEAAEAPAEKAHVIPSPDALCTGETGVEKNVCTQAAKKMKELLGGEWEAYVSCVIESRKSAEDGAPMESCLQTIKLPEAMGAAKDVWSGLKATPRVDALEQEYAKLKGRISGYSMKLGLDLQSGVERKLEIWDQKYEKIKALSSAKHAKELQLLSHEMQAFETQLQTIATGGGLERPGRGNLGPFAIEINSVSAATKLSAFGTHLDIDIELTTRSAMQHVAPALDVTVACQSRGKEYTDQTTAFHTQLNGAAKNTKHRDHIRLFFIPKFEGEPQHCTIELRTPQGGTGGRAYCFQKGSTRLGACAD